MTVNIDVRTNTEIVRINRAEKIVEARNLATGASSRERYDKLLLSPGAEPVKPPIPGIDEEGIFTLRSVADSDRIRRHLTEKKPAAAVVVGGGFIGLEMAENLKRLGIDVTVVRYFTVYGPYGRPDMSMFRFTQWISEGRPVLLNGDGEQCAASCPAGQGA